MTGTYNSYGGEQRCIQVLVGYLKEIDQMEDTAVDGRIILR